MSYKSTCYYLHGIIDMALDSLGNIQDIALSIWFQSSEAVSK